MPAAASTYSVPAYISVPPAGVVRRNAVALTGTVPSFDNCEKIVQWYDG